MKERAKPKTLVKDLLKYSLSSKTKKIRLKKFTRKNHMCSKLPMKPGLLVNVNNVIYKIEIVFLKFDKNVVAIPQRSSFSWMTYIMLWSPSKSYCLQMKSQIASKDLIFARPEVMLWINSVAVTFNHIICFQHTTTNSASSTLIFNFIFYFISMCFTVTAKTVQIFFSLIALVHYN